MIRRWSASCPCTITAEIAAGVYDIRAPQNVVWRAMRPSAEEMRGAGYFSWGLPLRLIMHVEGAAEIELTRTSA